MEIDFDKFKAYAFEVYKYKSLHKKTKSIDTFTTQTMCLFYFTLIYFNFGDISEIILKIKSQSKVVKLVHLTPFSSCAILF